jgi:uncharacterized protein involved in outer membrane biogenesis
MTGPISKTLKRSLFALGAVFGLAVLGGAIAVFSLGHYSKSQLEGAVSNALGMQVTIGGGIKVRLFPSFGATLQDVHIRNQGAEVVAAQEARLGIELLPLLRRQLRIPVIGLTHITLMVEQGRDGNFNFEGPSSAAATLPAIDSTNVSLADLTLLYTDKQNGNQWRAGPCNVQISHLQMSAAKTAEIMNNLVITAAVSCKQIQTRKFLMTDVMFTLDAKQALFDFKDITMRAYDGHGSGEVHANFSRPVPTYRVHYVLSMLRVEPI